jgi:hypothetical protein
MQVERLKTGGQDYAYMELQFRLTSYRKSKETPERRF